MEPYWQGALDNLCGIYSIVNATRRVYRINKEKASELFGEIIDFLDNKWTMKRVMQEGISLHDISKILNNIIKPKFPTIRIEAPFWKSPNTPLNEFWDEMMNFYNESNTAILIGIGGVYDHWTVVKSIYDKQIELFDSAGINNFLRRNCTTQRTDRRRKHKLYPTYTYFLRRKAA